MTESRAMKLKDARKLGAILTYTRELDHMPLGAIVRANSAPDPVYFRRSLTGWQACDEDGNTDLHIELTLELPGWPHALMARDILTPAVVAYLPEKMHYAPRTLKMAGANR